MSGKLGFDRDLQYIKFSAYGFLKNLQFAEPFLILFLRARGLDYLEIGSLYAIRMVAVNLLEIPSGFAADAWGRRRTMVTAFVAYLISFVFFYLGRSFSAFIPAMLLFASGEAFRTGTHKAMIMSYLELRGWLHFKTHYYGRTRSWSQLGAAVSALIAAAIVFARQSYAEIFLFSMIPYALDALLLASYPRELEGPSGGREGKRAKGAERRRQLAEALSHTGRELLRAARDPRRGLTVLNASLLGAFYKASKDFLQPMVQALALSLPFLIDAGEARRSAVLIGVVYSVLYVATSFASRYAGGIGDRLGPLERSLNVELAAGLAVTLAAGTAHALGYSAVAVVMFMLLFLVQNARRPLSVTYISDAVSQDIQATALSVESQVQSLFGAAFAFAIGAVADAAGGEIGVGVAVVAGVALLLFPLYRLRPVSQ
ncbi:MAG: MFS transporter [Spirochaetia bacterium]